MESEALIPTRIFCNHYNVDISFIQSMNDYGWIEFIVIDEVEYIEKEQISELERIIRLHYDLEINMEGIDAIFHLLKRVDSLHDELNILKNKVKLLDTDSE